MFSFRFEHSCLLVVLLNKIVDFTVARMIAKNKMKKTKQFEFFVSDFFVVVDMHTEYATCILIGLVLLFFCL